MRIQRVLLITLASQNFVSNNVNSGVGYISEAIENMDIEYNIIDMLTGNTYNDLKNKIRKYGPGLLAFNMFTPMYLRNYEFLQQIKDDFPTIPIMCGGPHISTVKDQALKDCKAIDYGFLNEGEETISEFIAGVEEENINGLIRRVNDKIILNPTRLPILNLDNISFPKYRKVNFKPYVMHAIPLVTSRGCPYSCIFCTVKSTMGKKIRFRSPENVVNG